MATAFHGVGAYRGQRNPIALSRQISTALSGVEICVADRPIGAFGIIAEGFMRAAFAGDCWSFVDGNGDRWTNSGMARISAGADGDIEQSAWEQFAQEKLARDGDGYCEGWLRGCALRAVWVKDWAPARTVKAARIISRHRGVPMLIVSGQTRIWDVLDNHQLPFRWAA